MSCNTVFKALKDCQKKHPREHKLICNHLVIRAGFCFFEDICPKEVRDLEDCAGATRPSGLGSGLPANCQLKAEILSACLEGYQDALEIVGKEVAEKAKRAALESRRQRELSHTSIIDSDNPSASPSSPHPISESLSNEAV